MRILVLCLVIAGCSTPAPEPSNQNRTAGGEQPPTVAASGPRSLEGRWFFLEVDDEDVEFVLEVNGDEASVWEDDPGERMPVRLIRGDDLVEVELQGLERRILLAPQDDDSALAFASGEDEARLARRAVPVPDALQGTWHLADPEDPRVALVVVEVSGDRISYVERDEARSGQIWGLGPAGPTLDVVVSLTSPEGRARLRWARFFRVAPDVFVVTSGGDVGDSFLVAHRPGRPPDWLRAGPGGRELD